MMDPELGIQDLQPIDLARYEEGFRTRMRGESFHILDSLDASWRAGWHDAKKAQAENPDAPLEQSPQSPLNLKGY
jgi:hypothetical protein